MLRSSGESRLISLALLVIVATVQAQAPTTNAVNKWTFADGKFTASEGTVAECKAGMDVFPEKGVVSFADFSVEYKGTYKIVTNKGSTPPTKYLLWQRGCQKPPEADDKATFKASFEIPLRSIAMDSSTYFPAMEAMGERAALRYYTSSWGLFTSIPCIHKQVDQAWTELGRSTVQWNATRGGYFSKHNETTGETTLDTKLNALGIEATFASCFNDLQTGECTSYLQAPGVVVMADTRESSFYAMSEWVEYIALFFNREKKVGEIADTSRTRWLCHSANHKVAISTTPKVLLLEWYNESNPDYKTYKGWEMKSCLYCTDGSDPVLEGKSWKCKALGVDAKPAPTYRWCEVIKSAGGQPLNELVPTIPKKDQTESPTVGPWKGYQPGSVSGLTTAQLVEFAKDADTVIILGTACYWYDDVTYQPLPNNPMNGERCSTWWTGKVAELSGIKAVRDGNVWDNMRLLDPEGGIDYLSKTTLEPDVLLEDVLKIVYNDKSLATTKHSLVFMRNAMSEGLGNKYSCKDSDKIGCVPDKASISSKCTDYSAQVPLTADACTPLTSGVPGGAMGTARALALAAFLTVLHTLMDAFY